MNLSERIDAFAETGRVLRDALDDRPEGHAAGLSEIIRNQQNINPWFTPGNVRMAISAIAQKLTPENLLAWTGRYPELGENLRPVKAGVIMAGNIPLAGFHDFLAVLITGNHLVAKTSSKDPDLIVSIGKILCEIDRRFEKLMTFCEGTLTDFDVVIATGSDNSSRYFDYYFRDYPHIIRHNRNSIAIISGSETDEELRALGTDVFSYFGLGCRSVSKLFLPRNFSPGRIVPPWREFSDIINHNKYVNNYEYNLAVSMVNREPFTDTGFLLLKESQSLSSPVAVLYYEYYDSEDELTMNLRKYRDRIQCIVSDSDVPFGKAQYPELWDYADDTDTVEFLLKKKSSGNNVK